MHLPLYRKATVLILLVFISFCTLVSAQDSKTNLVGGSILAEHDAEKLFMPSIGFVFERTLTKRSGIETGVFYKANQEEFQVVFITPEGSRAWSSVKIRESYLTLPILYRYYTKAVTLSLGPVFEGFVGWNQISTDEINVESYKRDPSVDFGPLLKVSKRFSLGKNLVLEPEFRIGFMAISTEAYYGVGVQLKQRLLKKN